MTSREDMLRTPERYKSPHLKPIYVVEAFENPDKQILSKDGNGVGLPDRGRVNESGFFHDLDEAIDAVSNNARHVWKRIYGACFILKRYPGLNETTRSGNRMYFVYDEEAGRYVQKEEPEHFSMFVY